MDVYKIQGGNRLKGKITVSGAKNSAVALIPASILADSSVTIGGIPEISDAWTLKALLEEIGGEVTFENGKMTIDPSKMVAMPLPNGNVKKLRASYYMMGAMLGRFKQAVIGMPGGCFLGPRPIDQHIKGFEALGAKVTNEHGAIYLRADELIGAKIYLDVASVGATINIMLAAVRAKGKTTIENAAKEPEIIDVATLLTNMGANIKGAGTSVIRIEGVDELKGTKHTIIPDRIEAATFMIMAAAIGDGVLVDNVIPLHMEAVTAKLREMGVTVEENEESIYISKQKNLQAVDVKTLVYPGFPTDVQQPLSVLMTQAEGTSMITDTIYSARFKHIDELRRMSAKARVEGNTAIIQGPASLEGSTVTATDLRAGAALVLAGLIAKGETEIHDIYHIERGYSSLIEKLCAIGANIRKESIVIKTKNNA
ncbi:UDP-N-acetylglucosamine 1-carboxyvinyltransferase [Solibacillus kalamii]|uniref:UDP-N-acetylglucosamine 1-carboxyvinyltransferase n=3 Tax=Solibacillus TaxID=648800 RepID=F2F759_SOLSS|nr:MULTISPECIES: UDP-N-acetylglucosamine 1-carboxyvinyltransferase [Solibacillus]AMO84272.1 UDP-N-acetylglucosamine 1-carboxyvinyltransferase [Solibacillus silvestris]EKB46098.1 UDP-N-acetylglucosamine 1-carboxyvinyltransferase 2 [Solibacillus isronensis B3W22]MBM7664765.1 UDP-N-acetylglucosamine 1-carboxyvinyltransferase [Solibacillus kalamii]OBW58913.1 UDP-N-acetylglucosamine 1-carboxyvinyltransferase [Solibacillus silvestris]OUZ40859.1 UDP-N-acetylglucosamine 1-carboxyvinyltransferase [Soli